MLSSVQNRTKSDFEQEVMQNERISYVGRIHGTGGRKIYSLCQRGGLQRLCGRIGGCQTADGPYADSDIAV